MNKKFLLKHVGNIGDLIFFIPPIVASLKKHYPDCHITVVTAWGFKEKNRWWGRRNQDGFCIAALAADPHIDQLVHWHDTALSLEQTICCEEGRCFPTWNKKYFEQQKKSGIYDGVFELDFGIKVTDNPMERLYKAVGLPHEHNSYYRLYFTAQDRAVASAVMRYRAHPRIVLLEGLNSEATRGWDPNKIPALEAAIKQHYGIAPIWFGSRFVPDYQGRRLTLRQNIATLTHCDVAIGVLSGPLHMAAAAGIPTLTLYCDHPLHRAAPAYFLNRFITDPRRRHRTLLGPSPTPMRLFKTDTPCSNLIPAEQATQGFRHWLKPGRQATKSCLSVITVDEIMMVLTQMLPPLTAPAPLRAS
jgi:hypothetical protein